MNDGLPNDADGDALRSLIQHGSDLTRPLKIDFAVRITDPEIGRPFAALAEASGFCASISLDEASQLWTCYCTRVMVPSYEAIIAVQRQLEELGKRFDAVPDGWGTFGNAGGA